MEELRKVPTTEAEISIRRMRENMDQTAKFIGNPVLEAERRAEETKAQDQKLEGGTDG